MKRAASRLQQTVTHLESSTVRSPFQHQQAKMSSQYKPSVSWGHNVTKSSEKADKLVELAKGVAEYEKNLKSPSGFYVVIAPREGQHFSQSTRLEVIFNGNKDEYEGIHKKSDAYKKLDSEQDDLLEKPTMAMTFNTHTGFLWRDEVPKVPVGEQFVWIAKLDANEGKLQDLKDAIKIHAGNVQRTEDGCLSFLVLESNDKKDSVTLFERYTTEEYFNEVHSKSESMQEYRKKMESILKERVSAGFRIVAGFVDKREDLA